MSSLLSVHRSLGLPIFRFLSNLVCSELCGIRSTVILFTCPRGQSNDEKPSESDDVILFQRLISFKNYHINVGTLDYMGSLGTRLSRPIMVMGSEGRSPSESATFSYFLFSHFRD